MSAAKLAGCRTSGTTCRQAGRPQGAVEANGDQVVMHPVLAQFQAFLDCDPVLRMYGDQMIAQVPGNKPYTKRIWRTSSRCCASSTRC